MPLTLIHGHFSMVWTSVHGYGQFSMLWTVLHEWKAIKCPLTVCPFVLRVVSDQNCPQDLDLSTKIYSSLITFLGHWKGHARAFWSADSGF